MSVFEGLKNAEVFERGTFINGNGMFDFEVERMIVRDTFKKGVCFFVELRVLASTLADHPVGSKVSWCQKMQDKRTAFSNLKPLFYAALGYSYPSDKEVLEKEIDPKLQAIADSAVGKDNPMKGVKLHAETSMIKTKETGGDFTVFTWAPGK